MSSNDDSDNTHERQVKERQSLDMNQLTEEEFRPRYTLTKKAFEYVHTEVAHLHTSDTLELPCTDVAWTPAHCSPAGWNIELNKLLCRFLADAGHFRIVGDPYGISETTVCRLVHQVTAGIIYNSIQHIRSNFRHHYVYKPGLLNACLQCSWNTARRPSLSATIYYLGHKLGDKSA
jgi:hypothetical protein